MRAAKSVRVSPCGAGGGPDRPRTPAALADPRPEWHRRYGPPRRRSRVPASAPRHGPECRAFPQPVRKGGAALQRRGDDATPGRGFGGRATQLLPARGTQRVVAPPAIEGSALRFAVAQQRQLHGVSVIIPDHPFSPLLRSRGPHPTGWLDDRDTVPGSPCRCTNLRAFLHPIEATLPDAAPEARIGQSCFLGSMPMQQILPHVADPRCYPCRGIMVCDPASEATSGNSRRLRTHSGALMAAWAARVHNDWNGWYQCAPEGPSRRNVA